MSRSHHRLLTLLLCFFLSFIFSIGQIFWPLSAVMATDSPTLIAQVSSQERGRKFYESGQVTEAIVAWEQAVHALAAQGDTLNQASVLSNLALAYQQLDNWGQAQTAMAHSLELIAEIEPVNSSETARVFAQVWNTQGNLALLRSQPIQALAAFEKATNYYGAAHDDSGVLRSHINQAQALQAMGFYRRAITILTDTTLDLNNQPDSPIKATGLRLLGDLQRAIGDLDASQRSLEMGATTAQSLDDADVLASLQLSLGHTVKAQGETGAALNYYQLAATTAVSPQLKLRTQLSYWRFLIETDNFSKAEELYNKIQSTLVRLPVSRVTVNAHLELARQLLDQGGNQQQVLGELAIAKQQAIALQDSRAESYALGYLGELYWQQQWQSAEQLTRQALTLADTIQAPDLAYQWHWHLGKLQRQQGHATEALNSYEQAVNNLQALRSNLIAVAPDLRFDFREQVEPVYREWVDVLLTEAKTETPQQQTQLIKARQAIEALQLAELENFFQEPCVPISQEIDQVIENAKSPTAVLYPIILPDRLEIILKLPQQPLQQYTVAVPQQTLESLLTDLQRDLLRPFTLKQWQAESAQLYEWLFQPTEAALEASQIDTLVFVLDGFLRSLPMAALYDGQQYLVEKYSIALAPGLQLVDPQPLQRRDLATVIAGLSKSRHGFSALAFVEDEVEQVQKNTPSHVLLNETFTAENLAAAINDTPFPLVHLATHGQFSSNPDETFVLAWDQPIAMNALNQLLRQGEQARQRAIELLILSACETAVGDKRAALGLAGVAVQAGARSTLASLWNLDDESGAIFSNLFYQELQKPDISKAQALRNTQLRLLTEFKAPRPIFEHPRYWAPYVLLGNWL